MSKQEFTPVGAVHLHIDGDDVVIRGEADRSTALLDAPNAVDAAASPVEITTDATHVRTPGPVNLRLPAGISVHITGIVDDIVLRNIGDASLESCRGDLVGNELASLILTGSVRGDVALRRIDGAVQLQDVRGDLAVANVGSLHAHRVRGDVSISNTPEVQIDEVEADLSAAHGAQLRVATVNGDVALSSVTGEASLDHVGGDVSVSSPGQVLKLPQVGGDVALSGPLIPHSVCQIHAGGDVAARISGNARVSVRAGGDVMGASDLKLELEQDGWARGRLGEDADAAELEISAGGDVVVNSPGGAQRQYRASVDAELKKAQREIRSELKRAAGGVKVEAKRAQKGIQVDMSGIEMAKAAGASVRDIVRDLLGSLDPKTAQTPVSSAGAPTPSDAPTADELRMVLEMLESGAITAEEAEQLIQALMRG